MVLGLFSWWCVMQQVSLHIFFGYLWLVGSRMQHFNNQFPKSKSGNSIHSQTCIKRNNFRFRWTVRNRSLFLTNQNYGPERVTSKYAQNSSLRSILSLQGLLQSQSLETILVCIVVLWFPTWQYCPVLWCISEIKRAKHLSQALVHLEVCLASSILTWV